MTGIWKPRVLEHKQAQGEFDGRYKIDRLSYFDRFGDIHAAIAREKQIKGLCEIKKIARCVHKSRVERSERSVIRATRYQPESDRSFVGRPSLCEGRCAPQVELARTTKGRLTPPRERPNANDQRPNSYVPSLQPARYSSCSGVSLSILIPMDSSFSLATRLSRSSGTR